VLVTRLCSHALCPVESISVVEVARYNASPSLFVMNLLLTISDELFCSACPSFLYAPTVVLFVIMLDSGTRMFLVLLLMYTLSCVNLPRTVAPIDLSILAGIGYENSTLK
jgi:hypothetical protein